MVLEIILSESRGRSVFIVLDSFAYDGCAVAVADEDDVAACREVALHGGYDCGDVGRAGHICGGPVNRGEIYRGDLVNVSPGRDQCSCPCVQLTYQRQQEHDSLPPRGRL